MLRVFIALPLFKSHFRSAQNLLDGHEGGVHAIVENSDFPRNSTVDAYSCEEIY